ncbi:MAG: YkvA family protein [Cyanobacteria bacterium J06648_10]
MKKKQNNNSISSALHTLYRKALKHTKYRWVVILGTLVYLVSPLDISPDVFPIIGWIDDGLIASLLITEVSQIVTEELKRKSRFKRTDNTAQTTQVETVINTEDIKTINVEAVAVS